MSVQRVREKSDIMEQKPGTRVDIASGVTLIGILGLQGAFFEHKQAFERIITGGLYKKENIKVKYVRSRDDFQDLKGLVIPGGESTTTSLFIRENDLEVTIRDWMANSSHVTWGTCAGMILLAEKLHGGNGKRDEQVKLGGLPVKVSRNYFGRQVNSFEVQLDIHDDALRKESPFNGIFIRAPAVVEICDVDVKILAKLPIYSGTDQDTKSIEGVDVAVRYKNVIATAFHPELTDDLRWHHYFLDMVLADCG